MIEQEMRKKMEDAIQEWQYGAKIVSSLATILLALIKEAGYKSPEEIELMYNPDYLDFKKGVEATKELYNCVKLSEGMKDTVMSSAEIEKIVQEVRKIDFMPDPRYVGEIIAEAQAEISFRLGKQEGIEEVVKWIEEYRRGEGYYQFEAGDWGVKLKEWRIDAEEGRRGIGIELDRNVAEEALPELAKEVGYVKLSKDQSFSWNSTGSIVSFSDCQQCFLDRFQQGWRKVEIKL